MPSEHPALVYDGMNSFVRCYNSYPTMSAHGYQMGGCVGFLKTLRRLCVEMQPSAVYICWEGGGSSRRRKLYPEYKMNRRPEKMNRFYEDDIPDSDENRKHQLESLIHMLRCVPVCQLYVQDCEGDDLVAHLCTTTLKGQNKIIVSSDKDLYQLLDGSTRLYSLHRKTFLTEETVFEEYRVKAKHFGLAKALCGDPGDNVPGIKGLGFKTVAKLFPILGSESDLLLQDVINYAVAHRSESKLLARVADSQDDLQRNWRLVFLDGNMLSGAQRIAVDQRVADHDPKADHVGLMRLLVKEGIGDFNVSDFFSGLSSIARGTR